MRAPEILKATLWIWTRVGRQKNGGRRRVRLLRTLRPTRYSQQRIPAACRTLPCLDAEENLGGCEKYRAVIEQCRCPSKDKKIIKDVCENCKKKRNERAA